MESFDGSDSIINTPTTSSSEYSDGSDLTINTDSSTTLSTDEEGSEEQDTNNKNHQDTQMKKIIKNIRYLKACFLITLDPQLQKILFPLTSMIRQSDSTSLSSQALINQIEQSTEQMKNLSQTLWEQVDNISILVDKLDQKQKSTTPNNYDTLTSRYNKSWRGK